MATTTEFCAERHEYTEGGVVIPSVTQVLELAGICDVSRIPAGILETARWRGEQVHMACEFDDQDDLDWESVPTELHGYVAAYRSFKQEFEAEIKQVEEVVAFSLKGLRCAGTLDRVAKLKGVRTLFDIKTTSKIEPHWALQTAAYNVAAAADERGVVWLKKDGAYQFVPHKNQTDIFVFEAALEVAHWRLKNGAKVKR